MTNALTNRTRWLALMVLCLGDLMIVLDTTIVNVALPSIRADLGFTETSLVWVVNAYMLTFGGFLLLGGRLGDLYGQRRLFLHRHRAVHAGLARLRAGDVADDADRRPRRAGPGRRGRLGRGAVADHDAVHRARRPGQGHGLLRLRHGRRRQRRRAPRRRAHRYAELALDLSRQPPDRHRGRRAEPDAAARRPRQREGAAKLDVGRRGDRSRSRSSSRSTPWSTAAEAGWTSAQTLGLLAAAAVLFVVFVIIESRVASPLVPLRLFRLRNLVTANIVGILWSTAMFAWFFLSALYMQMVLGYTALEVGLAFLPSNLIMGAFSLGLSAQGGDALRHPLAAGARAGAGRARVLAPSPALRSTAILVHVLPGMVLLGIGVGLAFNPVLLAAMSDVDQSESGLASGVVNTAFMMGGALGLAVLASLAAAVTEGLLATGARAAGRADRRLPCRLHRRRPHRRARGAPRRRPAPRREGAGRAAATASKRCPPTSTDMSKGRPTR